MMKGNESYQKIMLFFQFKTHKKKQTFSSIQLIPFNPVTYDSSKTLSYTYVLLRQFVC